MNINHFKRSKSESLKKKKKIYFQFINKTIKLPTSYNCDKYKRDKWQKYLQIEKQNNSQYTLKYYWNNS